MVKIIVIKFEIELKMKKIHIIKKRCLLFFAVSLLNIAFIQAQEETLEKMDSLDIVNVAFGTVARNDLLGAVSTVNVSELLRKDYYTGSLDGLQSFIGGYNGNIWGQSPLILVDGRPLNAWVVDPTQIESITVLKGAGAVVLYGSQGANGAVLITTKRGEIKPLTIDFRVNTGVFVPKRYPVYLNAAEYMTFYNEACDNDGISKRYDPALIQHTAAGTNPYRYPDLDLYTSEYLRKAYNKTDVTGEISGGNQRARYYTNFGISYSNDIVKYGEQKNNNNKRFNVRTNVDVDITNWLMASVDAGTVFSDSYSGNGNFWGTASTLRPNLYSSLIPIDMLDVSNRDIAGLLEASDRIVDGKYLFGGLSTNQTHAFADMLSGGYSRRKERAFLFNVNLNADLGSLLKGLSFKTGYSVDYNTFYVESWSEAYAVYEPTWSNMNGKDLIVGLTKYGVDRKTTTENINNATFAQIMSFRAHFNYNRSFAQHHHVSGLFGLWGFQHQDARDSDTESGSSYHRLSNANLVFQAAYNFRHKYYLDFSSAVAHSAKLPEGKRNALSPAVTVGWRLSEESFFRENISLVDNLKLTASYANLKKDTDLSDFYLYKTLYALNENDGAFWYETEAGGGRWYPRIRRGENPELTFIQRQEFRTGLELSLLKNLITLDANYFLQYTNGLLTNGSNTIYPSYYSSFLPNINNDKDKRTGVDFMLNLNKRIGQVDVSLGFAGMYFTSKAVIRDELWMDDYQYRAGRPLDSYWGYICEGFFKNGSDIENHATQTFGDVRPGDLKYKDINNDGVIDTRDQVDLGHNGSSVSPFTHGLHLTMKWKNFTLFAMGTGNSGAIGFKNNDYYWVRGIRKYSEVVLGRWTGPESEATYPRLSTTDNNNNFRNSTFWMYKTNRFDLTKVQLTYDIPKQLLAKLFVKDLSVYISGESLLTISKERKMMETNIGGAPYNRFFNFGFKTSF